MKKKPIIVELLEHIGLSAVRIGILAIFILVSAAGIEKAFNIPLYSDLVYLKDCYIRKVPYILTNLTEPNDITLYDSIDKELADAFYEDATVKVLNNKEFDALLLKWHYSNKPNSAVGLCVHPENTIYLRDKGAFYNYSLTLVHEYAHYASRNKGYANNIESEVIIKDEMQQLKKAVPGIGENIEEYKAETFAYYILLPDMLKKLAPATYEYHDKEYQRLLNES